MDQDRDEIERQGVPTRRSSIPSFLFITFILFMLTNHNSEEFLARSHYQEALQGLAWQRANYTAWLNGTTSNFTMPDRDKTVHSFLDSFVFFEQPIDPETSSYYSNITGFIRGDTLLHNITLAHYADNITTINSPWRQQAELLMNGSHAKGLQDLLGSWNWTATDKIAMSLVETFPTSAADLALTDVAVLHGRFEMTDSVTGDSISLGFDGVHLIKTGAIYGFAKPKGKIDIRLLPSLVPEAYRNATAQVILRELDVRAGKLRSLIEGGIIDTDYTESNDEIPRSTCPFVFYGQLTPAAIPQRLMQELEEEMQNPKGISTPPIPKLAMNGIVLSRECGIFYRVINTEGLRSRTYFRKVMTYAGVAALSYLALLVLCSRQMQLSRTPAGLSRLSRWTFLSQALVDAISFAGHITFGILAEGRVSLSLIAPGFLACMLFVWETQFSLLIYQVQRPEDISAAASLRPTITATANAVGDEVAQGQTTTAATAAAPLTFYRSFTNHFRGDSQIRAWLFIFLLMTFIIRVVISPSLALFFIAILYSLFWAPQIIRAVRRGRSGGLTREYIFGTTICRLWSVFYYLVCPRNVLDVQPRPWVYWLALFMFVQIGVLVLQDYLGPTFFLPKHYFAVPVYDYHPPLPVPDPEAPEQSLGDCSICMEPIVVDTNVKKRSKSFDGREKGEERMGLLGAMQITNARKSYSLAPCSHLFHTECLERWLAIKNICPQCRRPLPPL